MGFIDDFKGRLLGTVGEVASILTLDLWKAFYFGGDDYATPDPTVEGMEGAHALIAEMAIEIATEWLSSGDSEKGVQEAFDEWVNKKATEIYLKKYPKYAAKVIDSYSDLSDELLLEACSRIVVMVDEKPNGLDAHSLIGELVARHSAMVGVKIEKRVPATIAAKDYPH